MYTKKHYYRFIHVIRYLKSKNNNKKKTTSWNCLHNNGSHDMSIRYYNTVTHY